MSFVGPLTSFSAPEHCSSALLSCSLRQGTSQCTASYGLTCGPNGTPTLAADCYPNGKSFVATSYPTYMPGEACPSPYTVGTSTTYTTYTRPSGAYNPVPTLSYFKATNVICCPPGYDYSNGCTSTIPETATVQYLCDLNTPIPLTVPYKKTGNVLWYAYITGTAYPSNTWVYEGAVARKVEYVSGSVGTGPWPTATSSTYSYHYGSGSGSGSGSSSSHNSASISLRNKTTKKIVIGVVVPIVVAFVGALLLLCKKRKKNKSTESGESHANNVVASNQPVATTNNGVATPQVAQNTTAPSFFAPTPSAYAPPVHPTKQEAVYGIHELGPRITTEHAARLDAEYSRVQQVTALEQEQARIQAEIERLKNPRS